jgi:hypothetical protein
VFVKRLVLTVALFLGTVSACDPALATAAAPSDPVKIFLDALHQKWVNRDPVLDRIANCEGYPRFVYLDHGPESTASGKYGFVDGTWRSYRGFLGARYARAMQAPELVQDLVAQRLLEVEGTDPWDASAKCWRGRRT